VFRLYSIYLKTSNSAFEFDNIVATKRQRKSSVRQPVLALSPSGTHDQVTRFWLQSKQLRFCLLWGVLPVERTGLSYKSQPLFVSSNLYICTFWVFINIFVLVFLSFFVLLHFKCRVSIHTPDLSAQVLYSRLCLRLIYCPRI